MRCKTFHYSNTCDRFCHTWMVIFAVARDARFIQVILPCRREKGVLFMFSRFFGLSKSGLVWKLPDRSGISLSHQVLKEDSRNPCFLFLNSENGIMLSSGSIKFSRNSGENRIESLFKTRPDEISPDRVRPAASRTSPLHETEQTGYLKTSINPARRSHRIKDSAQPTAYNIRHGGSARWHQSNDGLATSLRPKLPFMSKGDCGIRVVSVNGTARRPSRPALFKACC